MWRTLLYFGIPKYLVECLKDLYQNQTAEVETVVGRTGPLSVQRGCPPSSMRFNVYSELIMRHALEKWEDGIEIVGTFFNNLRYAYDVALLATTERNLQQLVNDVGKASERFGLSLNQRSYSYAKMFISAPSPRDLKEVTPSGGRRSRKP